jgi:hypothetical protein
MGIRTIRRFAAWLHLLLAVAIVAGVCLQVYLIGAYVFGAVDALEAHRSAGFTVHGLEVLILVLALVAWLPRTDVLLSGTMAVAGTAQLALASATGPWVAALHPFGALVILALGTVLASRGARRGARQSGPAAG